MHLHSSLTWGACQLFPLNKQFLHPGLRLFIVHRKLCQLCCIGIECSFIQFVFQCLYMCLSLLDVAFHVLDSADFGLYTFFATCPGGRSGCSRFSPARWLFISTFYLQSGREIEHDWALARAVLGVISQVRNHDTIV